MSNTLLKNVVAAIPANVNLQPSTNPGFIFPASLKVALNDGAGNGIDATAGTVSFAVEVGKVYTDPEGNAQTNTTGTSAIAPSVDGSVAGFLTLTIPESTNSVPPGIYQLSVAARDSAGGSTQLLAKGTIQLGQVA